MSLDMCRVLFFALSVSVAVSVAAEPDAELKAALDDIVASYMSIPNAEMFTTVHDISPQKPFIFFHVPKAGGSSLRETIHKAAAKAHLRSFIPCYEHVPCTTTSFPQGRNASDIAVYAGHFRTSQVSEHSMVTLPFKDYYGISNLRDPRDHLVSLIYYSIQQQGKWKSMENGQCINDFEPSALKAMIQSASLVDATFSFLSGHNGHIQRKDAPNEEIIQGFNATLRHLAKCIPTILEEPMSFKLLSMRYPQLGRYRAFDPATVINVGKVKELCDKPSPAHVKVLEEAMMLERILYNAVKAKFRSRLSELEQG